MAIEPPSQSLLHSLQSLHLATGNDLRACEKYTRQLVIDLPAFDSVWIDALVQGGRVTPFQARLLNNDPESLRVGSYVLVDRLPHDGWPVRFRAVPHGGDQHVGLTVLPLEGTELVQSRERLETHVALTRTLTHRGLCLIQDVESDSRNLIAVSPLPIGESIQDLYVRRGRFPAEIVEEIARQLLEAQSQLEQVGTLHGDLRLRNVLLGPAGRIQLINAGILAAAYPRITIHHELPIHCYEGLAPELVGGRRERDSASEQYAIGCLFWHLLAGRAPFLPADRIDQMAAHQSLSIPDVRKYAPDTPAHLAAVVTRLTARHATERFTSLGAASRELGPSQARGRAQLVPFQASFHSVVPIRLGEPQRRRPRSRTQLVLTALVMLAAAISFLVPGAGQKVIETAGRLLQARQDLATSPPAEPETSFQIPEPETQSVDPVAQAEIDAAAPTESSRLYGIVILDQPVHKVPNGQLVSSSDLKIIGAEGMRHVIEVHDRPIRLAAKQRVILENVIIRRSVHSQYEGPLIEADCQILIARHCDFIGGRLTTAASTANSLAPLVRWKHVDENDILPGEIQLTHCLVAGGGTVVSCESVPQSVELTDSVCVGTGTICEVHHAPSARTLQMQLTRSTLRSTGPLLREFDITLERQTPVSIDLRNTVVELQQNCALVEAIGQLRGRWTPDLKIDAVESYLSRESSFVGTRLEKSDELMPLDPAYLKIEGLQFADLEFAGPPSTRWDHHIITQFAADVQAGQTPGIGARAVPTTPSPQSMTPRRNPLTTVQ